MVVPHASPTRYVPLWVKSNFSFLEGASHPEELCDRAHALELPALAITDRDGVYGIVRAHMRAREVGLPLVLGSELTLDDDARVLALCESREGYGHLCRLISRGHQRSKKGTSVLHLEELCELSAGLCILCPEPTLLAPLSEAFDDRLYALCVRHLQAEAQPHEETLRERAQQLRVRTVAGNEVLYHHASRQALQDVLTCIRHGVTLTTAGRRIRPNAEHDLKSTRAMAQLFADDPASLARTLEVAERCRFSLDALRYRYPGERLPEGQSEASWLRQLTLRGASERFPLGVPDAVHAQIDKELRLIEQLEYGGYFLTMWEIVQFCRKSGILCQGRGSAANSVVCFCLGITAVDPIKLDLLFERFLSLERAEPPDIDLDIEHERREEVIQWVYERYGRRHAAMVANIIRYRTRSALRDVGKVLGLPITTVDRLAKLATHGELSHLDDSPTQRQLFELVEAIKDFPRHLSIHPGGFLLGDEPVDTIVPIEPATMDERTVIQWDKYAVEDLGLFKVDLLGLGALHQIHRCFDLLRKHDDIDLNMATVPHDDAETYAMISRGDTAGLFQIESRAQMSMLPRLQPQTFYDLVIEVAIVRPGPIQGDMVHPYLRRRRGEEQASYPHPALKRVLEKTLGVPIFQEQVMKIAVLVGGYTPGEADQLRRDMAAWKSSGRIDRHKDKLISRMIDNGITPEFAERIFSQIQGFGEYGFPESHAASFALIAYVTAWLRCHHPAAFACSLLNAQPMGFYAPATIVEDAKRHGIEVRPIDVHFSDWDCTLEPARHARDDNPWAVRMGLRYVQGLGVRERDALAWAPPPYRSLEDFMARTHLSRRAYQKLAEAGALDGVIEATAASRPGTTRRDAIWSVREIFARLDDGLHLGNAEGAQPRFVALSDHEEVLWDYRTSHHSARGHPMRGLRDALRAQGLPTASELNAMPDGTRMSFVGLTICRQRPGTATGVTFYTLEDETGFANLVVWRQVFERHTLVGRTALLLGAHGRVQSADGVVHLIADALFEPNLTVQLDGSSPRSFH